MMKYLIIGILFLGVGVLGFVLAANVKPSNDGDEAAMKYYRRHLPKEAENMALMSNGWCKFEIVVDGKRYKMIFYCDVDRCFAVKLEDMVTTR